jgi:hypothetical protein
MTDPELEHLRAAVIAWAADKPDIEGVWSSARMHGGP